MDTLPASPRTSKTRRITLWTVGILLCALGLLRVVIGFLLSPQALVDRIEAQMNARVEIGSAEISLFRLPCLIRLHDVRIGERDEASNNAEKLANRPAMERTLLSAKAMKLEGSPWALLSRKLDVADLVIDEAGADIRVRESGTINITKLFKQPAIVAGKPNPKKKFEAIVGDPAAGAGMASEEEPPVSIDEVPFAASVKSMVFNGARINAVLKKKGTLIDISGLRFELSDLDIDPNNLAAHNSGKVRIAGNVRVSMPEKDLEYAHMAILGEGSIRPFDPVTKALNPLVQAKLTLQDPSEITFLPSLAKINDRLEALKRVGINIGDKLGTSIQFADQTSVDIEYRDGVLRTLTPLLAKAQKIDVEMEPGAYLHSASNDHFFRVILTGNQSLSDRMKRQVEEKAKIIPAGKARDEFLKELMDSFFLDGRFRPICVSRGDMGDPEVDLENKLPDMGKFLQGVLQDIGLDPEVQKDIQESGTKLLEELLKRRK